MTVRDVACTSCNTALPPDLLDGAFHMCPRCLTWVRVHLFPAFTRQQPAAVNEPALIEGQSSCFYHPHKMAVVPCESCGRFLCSLCDVEIAGIHRCPKCLESGRRKQELHTLQTEHTRYDRIALALTTLALFFWPITVVTAPAALYMVIRYWNRRSKVLPGSRIGYVLAGLIAVAEICGWIFLFYLMIHRWPK